MRTTSLLATAATAFAIAASPMGAAASLAQDAASDDVIIVTAQKVEQSVVDVPQSVSVVSSKNLERNQAFGFQDVAKLVPGLQFTQTNPGETRIILRGINTGGVAATVATYVDETPFGSSTGQANGAILAGEFDTFDLARVEVLRGPQGTIYGANSLGGVIKYVTAEPSTGAFEGRVKASAETTRGGDESWSASAMLNVPLGETLAIRGTGFYRTYGGFVDSIGIAGSDVEDDINDTISYGGRVSALFTPSEAMSLRLTAYLQNLNSDAGTAVEADLATLRPLNGLSLSQYVPEYTNVAYRVYNATGTFDLGFATLTSTTSQSTLKERLRDDLTVLYGTALGLYSDATGPALDIGLPQQTNTKRFTQELRLGSSGNGFLDWLVGAYYNRETGAIIQRLDVYEPGTLNVVGDDVIPQLYDGFLRSRYQEWAGFANGTLHFGPSFDLTLGARYSHNKQSAAQAATGLIGFDPIDGKSSEDVFTWQVAPRFAIGENSSIYGRVAKGFRPGGPNFVPPGAPPELQDYDSDSLISYEVGVKAETADRSFGLDIAAFYIDWSDIQLFAQVEDFGINANGGKARSKGVEFTATTRPTRGLVVSINGAYTDTALLDDTDPLIGGRDGDALPFVPKYTVSINGDYDWSVGGDAMAYVGGTLRMQSSQSAGYSPTALAVTGDQYQIPSYVTVDTRAGVEFGRYTLEVYAKNLTDAQGITSVAGEGGYPNGAVGIGVIRPRTIGLSVGAGF